MANPNPFTPEEVAQILEAFFAAVGTRQYIGARYVPIFGRKGEDSIIWDNTKPYEPLTIVLYHGNSFTSRQYVPEGVDINDEDFWAVTGNYNAQVEQYRQEVQEINERVDVNTDSINGLTEKTNIYEIKENADNVTFAATDSKGVANFPQTAVEIDVDVNGSRSGHGVAHVISVNGPNAKGIAIGDSNTAIADFVGQSVLNKLRNCAIAYENTAIVSVSENTITFNTDISDYIEVGSILIIGTDISRVARDDSQTRYYDRLSERAWGGLVESVDNNTVTIVGGWREKASSENINPSGYSTPVIVQGSKCFVNPQNGVYGNYDLITAPDTSFAGYKMYHSQTHMYNEGSPMYVRGDLIVFHGSNNAFGFGATISGSTPNGILESFGMVDGNVKRFMQSGTTDLALGIYPQITTGGTIQRAAITIPQNLGSINLRDYIDSFAVATHPTYAPCIFKINGGNDVTVDVDKLMPNAKYEICLLGTSTLTIVNSDTALLPVTIAGNTARSDVAANKSITISRVSGNHHGYFELCYYIATSILATNGHNTSERDLFINAQNGLYMATLNE